MSSKNPSPGDRPLWQRLGLTQKEWETGCDFAVFQKGSSIERADWYHSRWFFFKKKCKDLLAILRSKDQAVKDAEVELAKRKAEVKQYKSDLKELMMTAHYDLGIARGGRDDAEPEKPKGVVSTFKQVKDSPNSHQSGNKGNNNQRKN